MAKALKRMLVSEYEETFDEVDGLVILDPGAMTVEVTQAFRKDLREKAGGARMERVHNRTARIALANTHYKAKPEALDEVLRGPCAVVFGGDGPIPIARVVREWRRRAKDMKLKGAVAEGEIFAAADVDALADLPTLPQLKAMLLSTVLGPARGIAVSLQAVYGGIARVLKARAEKLEGGTESEAAEGEAGASGA